MKRLLTLLLLSLILTGCTQGPRLQQSVPRLVPTKETENDILRRYPLGSAECRFFALDEELWMVENGQLLCYEGKNLTLKGKRELPSPNCMVIPAGDLLCCYDPKTREAIVIDRDLSQGTSFALPDTVRGTPMLSSDGSSLYYCTDKALMAMDTASGLPRKLRNGIPESFILTAVLDDALLCQEGSRSLFLSQEDGSLLAAAPEIQAAAVVGSRSCYAVRCGENCCLYLGNTMLPLTPEWEFFSFLPSAHSVLLRHRPPEEALAIYDLNTGNRTAYLSLDGTPVQAAMLEDGRIFFQTAGSSEMIQWNPRTDTFQDPKIHLSDVFTQEHPDTKGLAQCRQRAGFLEAQYGITIAMAGDALENHPAEYRMEAEHLIPILSDTLDRVERSLNRLLTDLLKQAFGGNTRLCLVRSIQDSAGNRLPYLFHSTGGRNILYLTVTHQAGDSILRCLMPLLEGRILSLCDAIDTWESLNPEDFHYSESAFLPAAFADTASTRSPTEDRAGVLLASITPGNRELFTSAILQAKLRQLSTGLRRAFQLSTPSSLPWEQYLWEPLVGIL